ncbi:MAG: hypothetical protein LUH05_03930 [Candidatus Gastranaerophilales bacterium]|nr:hypothetical protein [Candidatus Gastranaerophilales bacterium]
MAFTVDETTGDITLVQGDSGILYVTDLPTDENYTLYFAFYDDKRNIIGSEMSVQAKGEDTVSISILSSVTDLLTVDKKEDAAEYYYGLKLCLEDTGYENTLIINDGDIGDLNTVTVYPKKVEGIIT